MGNVVLESLILLFLRRTMTLDSVELNQLDLIWYVVLLTSRSFDLKRLVHGE